MPQKEAVLGMLRAKLQEEGLRTYLLAYGRFYSSLSIAQLCDMFELPERKVGDRRNIGAAEALAATCCHSRRLFVGDDLAQGARS